MATIPFSADECLALSKAAVEVASYKQRIAEVFAKRSDDKELAAKESKANADEARILLDCADRLRRAAALDQQAPRQEDKWDPAQPKPGPVDTFPVDHASRGPDATNMDLRRLG